MTLLSVLVIKVKVKENDVLVDETFKLNSLNFSPNKSSFILSNIDYVFVRYFYSTLCTVCYIQLTSSE